MCLLPTTPMMTAENEIRVWKKVYVSDDGSRWRGLYVYNKKTFPFGELCHENGAGRFSPRVVPHEVGAGFFHSYSDRWCAGNEFDPVVRDGFRRFAVVECVIPKGAKYFTGNMVFGHMDLASNMIIVHKPENL